MPDGELTKALVEALLGVRQPAEGLLVWPEKAESHLVNPAPSTAHTARAVRALAKVAAVAAQPSDQVQDALDQAVVWLLEHGDLSHASEVIDRPLDESGENLEKVYVRHFTAAWMVKALISAGIPATHPSVRNAVTQIWNSYSGDEPGLWRWENGDLPIWITFERSRCFAPRASGRPGPIQLTWGLRTLPGFHSWPRPVPGGVYR